MDNRKLVSAVILAGMTLATAWAIRGQFGHEQGAAWAGGIGGLGILLLAKREDWYARALQVSLAAGVGWGLGGMISYGMVVGYGRGLEFGNVYYGLAMLFVIGSLFGTLGGGLFGLALASNKSKPVEWSRLFVEMAVGGIIFYFFLIEQLGYLMTPPRPEAWAICLGMAVAMLAYMIRNRFYSPLKVAIWTALGAGFGFSFGNFLQVIGDALEIQFNFWNVMEYSIGFFGGMGMAYGTFTSEWDSTKTTVKKNKLLFPLIFLSLVIPFVVWEQSFDTDRLIRSLEAIVYQGDKARFVLTLQWIALLMLVLGMIYFVFRFYFLRSEKYIKITYRDLFQFFVWISASYTLYSIIITLAFISTSRIEQYLYVLNFGMIYYFIGKVNPVGKVRPLPVRRWLALLLLALVFIGLMTWIAINSHGEMPGAQRRFG